MKCRYCGNAYLNNDPRCDGCGSPKTARVAPAYRGADQLYAEVGHAIMTGEASKSRALLEKILGSPEKEPKKLWIERSAKVTLCLGVLYMAPQIGYFAAAMIMPFLITIYLPYRGLKTLFTWISGTTPQQ